MPKFNYIARDSVGKVYEGSMDAANESVIQEKLTNAGLYLTSATKESRSLFQLRQKIRENDLVTFAQQLADLIGAGIPLLRSLSALERQVDNPALKAIIGDIIFNIEAGKAFSEALTEHPEVFSEFFVGMVKAGETGGVLSKVLDRLASHLDRSYALRQKISSAFTYPILVSILACLAITFLVIVIVPIFSDVYKQLNIMLPGPTLALIFISDAARKYWWVFLSLIFVTPFVYKKIKDRPRVREYIDSVKINFPIFGKLNRLACVSRFVHTFGDMLGSGIVALEALNVADKVVGNVLVSKIVDRMKRSVTRGNPVTAPLENQDIFPQTTVQMMMAGEESGTLDKMLEKNAATLERDVDNLVNRIVTMIEPLLTAALATVVGFIAIAVYFPIFDMISQISNK